MYMASFTFLFSIDKKCGVIYEITCDQDPAHVYTGETKRPLGKRFKEHTNLTIATGVGNYGNATGHSVSLNNTKVLPINEP